MAVVRFVMLPKRLVVLVSLRASSLSLAIRDSSRCVGSIGGHLGALSRIHTGISRGLGFFGSSIALLGQCKRLICSSLCLLDGFGGRAATEHRARCSDCSYKEILITHFILTPKYKDNVAGQVTALQLATNYFESVDHYIKGINNIIQENIFAHSVHVTNISMNIHDHLKL